MKLEHFALNVENPLKMTEWYVLHLRLTVARQQMEPPYTTFLADDGGQILIEIYCNPANEVPNYKNMNPLQVHLAFVSADPESDSRRLMDAGATLITNDLLADGSHLIMLRDPWGLALQLCKRSISMLY